MNNRLETMMDSSSEVSPPSCAPETTTFFSTSGFVECVARCLDGCHRPAAIPVTGSGPLRTMYALETMGRFGVRYVSLAPFGLYASPGWDRRLERSTLKRVVNRLMGIRTRGFAWNVRFDQESLAAGLTSLGFNPSRTSTHALPLEQDYERVRSAYDSTIRNHVNAARRRGVVVRDAADAADVLQYYQVHTGLVRQKGGYETVYPLALFLDLVKFTGVVRLLIAECQGRSVAGGLFFRDGCSVMYWHAAMDREYSRFFPACAVIDEAIQWGCRSGATSFNLGGSAGIASLEEFKSYWGATRVLNWKFEWKNPFWSYLARLKKRIAEQNA